MIFSLDIEKTNKGCLFLNRAKKLLLKKGVTIFQVVQFYFSFFRYYSQAIKRFIIHTYFYNYRLFKNLITAIVKQFQNNNRQAHVKQILQKLKVLTINV